MRSGGEEPKSICKSLGGDKKWFCEDMVESQCTDQLATLCGEIHPGDTKADEDAIYECIKEAWTQPKDGDLAKALKNQTKFFSINIPGLPSEKTSAKNLSECVQTVADIIKKNGVPPPQVALKKAKESKELKPKGAKSEAWVDKAQKILDDMEAKESKAAKAKGAKSEAWVDKAQKILDDMEAKEAKAAKAKAEAEKAKPEKLKTPEQLAQSQDPELGKAVILTPDNFDKFLIYQKNGTPVILVVMDEAVNVKTSYYNTVIKELLESPDADKAYIAVLNTGDGNTCGQLWNKLAGLIISKKIKIDEKNNPPNLVVKDQIRPLVILKLLKNKLGTHAVLYDEERPALSASYAISPKFYFKNIQKGMIDAPMTVFVIRNNLDGDFLKEANEISKQKGRVFFVDWNDQKARSFAVQYLGIPPLPDNLSYEKFLFEVEPDNNGYLTISSSSYEKPTEGAKLAIDEMINASVLTKDSYQFRYVGKDNFDHYFGQNTKQDSIVVVGDPADPQTQMLLERISNGQMDLGLNPPMRLVMIPHTKDYKADETLENLGIKKDIKASNTPGIYKITRDGEGKRFVHSPYETHGFKTVHIKSTENDGKGNITSVKDNGVWKKSDFATNQKVLLVIGETNEGWNPSIASATNKLRHQIAEDMQDGSMMIEGNEIKEVVYISRADMIKLYADSPDDALFKAFLANQSLPQMFLATDSKKMRIFSPGPLPNGLSAVAIPKEDVVENSVKKKAALETKQKAEAEKAQAALETKQKAEAEKAQAALETKQKAEDAKEEKEAAAKAEVEKKKAEKDAKAAAAAKVENEAKQKAEFEAKQKADAEKAQAALETKQKADAEKAQAALEAQKKPEALKIPAPYSPGEQNQGYEVLTPSNFDVIFSKEMKDTVVYVWVLNPNLPEDKSLLDAFMVSHVNDGIIAVMDVSNKTTSEGLWDKLAGLKKSSKEMMIKAKDVQPPLFFQVKGGAPKSYKCTDDDFVSCFGVTLEKRLEDAKKAFEKAPDLIPEDTKKPEPPTPQPTLPKPVPAVSPVAGSQEGLKTSADSKKDTKAEETAKLEAQKKIEEENKADAAVADAKKKLEDAAIKKAADDEKQAKIGPYTIVNNDMDPKFSNGDTVKWIDNQNKVKEVMGGDFFGMAMLIGDNKADEIFGKEFSKLKEDSSKIKKTLPKVEVINELLTPPENEEELLKRKRVKKFDPPKDVSDHVNVVGVDGTSQSPINFNYKAYYQIPAADWGAKKYLSDKGNCLISIGQGILYAVDENKIDSLLNKVKKMSIKSWEISAEKFKCQ